MKTCKTNKLIGLLMVLLVSGILAACDSGSGSSDDNGNGDNTGSSFSWNSGYPSIDSSSTDETSVVFSAQTNQTGTLYYAVLKEGESAPSAATLIAGTADNSGNTNLYPDIERIVTINGLSDDTDYTLYAVAANSDGDQTTLFSGNFSTEAYSYPVDDDTVVFWIFSRDDTTAGDSLEYDSNTTVIEDLSGNGNNLFLTCYSKSGYSESDQTKLEWSSDTYYEHAKNTTSIKFSGSRTTGGYYLETTGNAPMTSETLADTGYTFEAVVKITENWDENEHKWMGITGLSVPYDSLISDYAYYGQDAPFMMAVSNLLEIQFAAYIYDASDGTFSNAATNWSAELSAGTWLHIAIVEQPYDGTTNNRVMYINGVEQTRTTGRATNGICAVSDLYDSMPYFVGAQADHWTSGVSSRNVFAGNIDAIRITKRALSTNEFLSMED